jgi:hypothetical protein
MRKKDLLAGNTTVRVGRYTLIEMVAALGITVIAAAAVAAAAAGGLQIYQRARIYSELQSDMLLGLERLERDLRNTFVIDGIAFQGTPTAVSFSGIIRAWRGEQEGLLNVPGRLTYGLDRSQGALVVWRQTYALAVREGEVPRGEVTVLARNIAGVEFSYYHYDTLTKRYSWLQNWTEEQEGVPVAVKITIKPVAGTTEDFVRTVFIPVARTLPRPPRPVPE